MESVCREFVVYLLLLSLLTLCSCDTDLNDVEILNQFREGLKNSELLKWPENGEDPCGPPSWGHVFCTGSRVSQIEVQGLGLKGSLPRNLNNLVKLTHLGLQNNHFTGSVPSLSGLSDLQYAYFDFNEFDSIPSDVFNGLTSLEVLVLDYNDLNATTGWSFPNELQDSNQLVNLSCISCNLAGPLPGFLGSIPSLTSLKLSRNRISGSIPTTFNGSGVEVLHLNDQRGDGMRGPINVVATMLSLTSLWLHGNHFSGAISAKIGELTSLRDVHLNGNELTGLIPDSLASMKLDELDLSNNRLMGPVPKFEALNASYDSNLFCQSHPGLPCTAEVMALLDFLGRLGYPSRLASSWSGNDPCGETWLGIECNPNKKVSAINLQQFRLNGTLSPSIANLDSLVEIRIGTNNITGPVPMNWTSLKSLKLLDLSGNNISPPLPSFSSSVKVIVDDNSLLSGNESSITGSPSRMPPQIANSPTPGGNSVKSTDASSSKKSIWFAVVAPFASLAVLVCVVASLLICYYKRGKEAPHAANSIVVHPRNTSDLDNRVKIVVANNMNRSVSSNAASCSASASRTSSMGDSYVVEAGNLVISIQLLRDATNDFAAENELGRGGFGVVYKGKMENGTTIAVKRMEAGVMTKKALDEFHAEITVLSKVRHRNLVSLLGYSVEGSERILVYEYMPKGALSEHLFVWKSLNIEPLSWKRRLNIALDVARGIEYLHTLAHQCFIHRDLKSSNILLGADHRAKVSDFGLVKLAPDGEKSFVTKLAGTFGYLAPEYAITGKVTTKVDVFSFGVVLVELLTGMVAVDENRPEESQYLAAWFQRIKSNKEKLISAIDPVLDVNEATIGSIFTIAELAGHCTAREPNQRPEMGRAVNVIASLVEKWEPLDNEDEDSSGIDYSLPLNQMVRGWQESECKDVSYMELEDTKGSIPARPTGFAESFTSADGRLSLLVPNTLAPKACKQNGKKLMER